jgi:hypothetical protein
MPEYIGAIHVTLVTGLPMAIAETKAFIHCCRSIFTEEELADVKLQLALDPEAGVVIPDTGGIRKIRCGARGKGKRGGARVIYFYFDREMPLYLLAAYAKGEQADISPLEKRRMRAMVEQLIEERRSQKIA